MASPGRSMITVRVPNGFDLSRAVCCYGYFLLAPNRWDPSTQRLFRPLRGDGDRLILTIISQRYRDRICIECAERVSRVEARLLRHQVARMLRLGEDFRPWHRLHRPARRAKFDRLFRSPTLFEDIVKTMTGCNVTWSGTMRMNALMCQHVGKGGFPTPCELAAVRADTLKRRCKVGYRSQRIVWLARRVVRGDLDLASLETPHQSTAMVFDRLTKIHGIGKYAAANLCQLLGRYDCVAIDSETLRHFRQYHGVTKTADPRAFYRRIEAHYARYAPYQFLAYWFELWSAYESRLGDARTWDAHQAGGSLAAFPSAGGAGR